MTQPPQPTLKDLVELPGPFSFKVILKQEHAHQEALMERVRQTLMREVGHVEITVSSSRAGTYQSFTLTLHIEVFEEVEALFAALRAAPGAVMVL